MVSFVIVTRDRPGELAWTLTRLGGLDDARLRGGEVIVVDNASRSVPTPPTALPNGLVVRLILKPTNQGASARNAGVAAAVSRWVVMLDDDSWPEHTGFLDELESAPAGVVAVGAEVVLTSGGREFGGLPEVFVGCGAAVRRDAFLVAGGYDPSFGYYAEEYDLCAKLIAGGGRVAHSRSFVVRHAKSGVNRDRSAILRLLARNNAWVEARHAPDASTARLAIARHAARYRSMAERNGDGGCSSGGGVGAEAVERGLAEAERTAGEQARTPMTREGYERFVGLSAARRRLGRVLPAMGARRVAVVARGKNDWVIDAVLAELSARSGIEVVERERDADAVVIGTLSPGPMLDAIAARAGRGGKPAVEGWSVRRRLAPARRAFPRRLALSP